MLSFPSLYSEIYEWIALISAFVLPIPTIYACFVQGERWPRLRQMGLLAALLSWVGMIAWLRILVQHADLADGAQILTRLPFDQPFDGTLLALPLLIVGLIFGYRSNHSLRWWWLTLIYLVGFWAAVLIRRGIGDEGMGEFTASVVLYTLILAAIPTVLTIYLGRVSDS